MDFLLFKTCSDDTDYIKIVTDEEVKDFVLIDFGKCFESTRELYSKLSKDKNQEKVDELFYSFVTTPHWR